MELRGDRMLKITKSKKQIIFGVVAILLMGCIVANIYCMMHPFHLKSDHIILNVDEKYNVHDNISFVYFGEAKDVKVDKKIDTSTIQEYKIKYSFRNYTKECRVTITDTQPPVLKLKDYETDMVEEVTLEHFIESCEDYSEVEISFVTDDLSKEGDTVVEIKAKDQYGNETIETCILKRKEDKNPPTIEEEFDTVEVMKGNSYDFSDISIKDEIDPNPVLSVEGDVDYATPGTYIVTLKASDRSGNVVEKQVYVIVKQNEEENLRCVYLTFDDGPSYNTPKVLEILARYNVKATFFVTGCGPGYNQYIVDAYNAGHAIGLHTFTHDYATVYASVDAYYNDLNSVGTMVRDLIGFVPNIIRFPGGSSNTVSANYSSGIMSQLVSSVQANGYQYYDWNVSSSDASGFGVPVQTIIESSTSGSGDKIMILFHDASGKDTTVEALSTIIEHYQSQGYIFMPINKDTSFVCHHGVNN